MFRYLAWASPQQRPPISSSYRPRSAAPGHALVLRRALVVQGVPAPLVSARGDEASGGVPQHQAGDGRGGGGAQRRALGGGQLPRLGGLGGGSRKNMTVSECTL